MPRQAGCLHHDCVAARISRKVGRVSSMVCCVSLPSLTNARATGLPRWDEQVSEVSAGNTGETYA